MVTLDYRVIDRDGSLVDVMLSEHRNLESLRAQAVRPIVAAHESGVRMPRFQST